MKVFGHVLRRKEIRIILGLLMAMCFGNLVLTINLLALVTSRIGSLTLGVLAVVSLSYLYMPCVWLIVVLYVLLTRVWKHEETIK
jgi:hypothetical protein